MTHRDAPDTAPDTGPDQVAEAVVVAVNRLRRRTRALAGPDGLSPSQRSVLSRLDRDGEASASELAAVERVRPQSMAATVRCLTDLGHVASAPDPHDRRRRVLSLTAQGSDWVRGTRRTQREWLAQALAETCTDLERATLAAAAAILERVAAS